MNEIRVISKKEYFNDKKLQQFKVDATVVEIGQWAFAHCVNLKEIWIPRSCEQIAPDCFVGCDALEQVVVYDETGEGRTCARLLALCMKQFQEYGFYDVTKAGTKAWYDLLDARLLRWFNEDERQGFTPFLAGGEEDYIGKENDIDYYIKTVRYQKSTFAYERLLQETIVSDELKENLVAVLKTPEAFAVLLKESVRQKSYYEILKQYDIITKDTLEQYMTMADEVPEVKAWLLQETEGNGFGDFEL